MGLLFVLFLCSFFQYGCDLIYYLFYFSKLSLSLHSIKVKILKISLVLILGLNLWYLVFYELLKRILVKLKQTLLSYMSLNKSTLETESFGIGK